MLKFLRKYNKYILAVFGTLLLITFLIPFAFTSLLQNVGRGGTTWATVDDDKPTKVSVSDLNDIRRELQVVQYSPQLAALGVDLPEHWYLLSREAQQAGLVPAASLLTQNAQSVQQLALVAARSGENPLFVAETMAKAQGVANLLQLYRADRYSDRRLKQRARRLFHGVRVQPLVIEASAPDDPPALTEAELLEQMEKYADVPGEGEMGFGYRLPDRVRLEWLEVPADSVRAMIEASDQLNPVALRKHWLKNTADFGTPDPEAAVPDEVRTDLLETLTAGTLDEIARWTNDQLRLARRGLPQRGGYLEFPQGWTGPDLPELALSIQAEEKFSGIDLPIYHATGEPWLTAEDVPDLAGVGAATSDKFGPTPVGLMDLVMATREFGGSPTIPIQKGVAGPPMRGADGSVFFFRVIDADPSRPPESIDEVRDELVRDLRRLAHYRQLVETADSVRQVAIEEGLLAVAMLYDTAVSPTVNVSLGFPATFPVIGQHRATSEAIVDHAMGLPQDLPMQEVPVEDRMLVVPVEDSLSLLVVRLTDQTPLTDETYQSYAQFGILQGQLTRENTGDIDPSTQAFSYDALAERHKFQFASGDAPTTQPDQTAGSP